jgi:hypothetical protein
MRHIQQEALVGLVPRVDLQLDRPVLPAPFDVECNDDEVLAEEVVDGVGAEPVEKAIDGSG